MVNAVGVVVDRDGKIVRGNLDPATGQRRGPVDELEKSFRKKEPPHGNTTLTLVVTNQQLPYDALTQLGRQVHSSMARAINPFHTMFDGDTLFTVTTGEITSDLSVGVAGMVASELAWDAVLSAVREP